MWKIVIIDDDFQVARGLRKAIPWEELDAEFAGEAIDGETGLRLIEETNPDIVLTDIYMPVMNGIQMIEQLKSRSFSGRFVILSGYNDFEYARTAIRLGVDDYLTKPVTVKQIREVLAMTISKLEETYLHRLESSSVQEMQNEEREAQPRDQAEWLAAVLNGWLSISSEPPAGPQQWIDGRYTVMVMEVLWTERIRSISLADWNLFKFAVSNIVTEVYGHLWPSANFVWLFGNHAALLLQSGPEQSDNTILHKAEHLGERIVHSMKSYLNLEVRFGIGDVKRGWQQIKESGDEAMQRLFEKLPLHLKSERDMEVGGIQAGQEVEHLPESKEVFLAGYFRKMTEALREERDDEVMRLIGIYLERSQPNRQENPLYYRLLAAEAWTLLHNALLAAGISGKSDDEGLILREISEMTGLGKIEEWLERQIRVLRQQQGPAIHEKHRKAVQYMIEYVHAHYAEDITLEQLASQLYISKNYLNQLFKKVTGETFTNYVIRVRIEKAKALLMEGRHLIYEVSEMVGYQNVPYFSTLFKKYCGVSPSELMKR